MGTTALAPEHRKPNVNCRAVITSLIHFHPLHQRPNPHSVDCTADENPLDTSDIPGDDATDRSKMIPVHGTTRVQIAPMA